MKKSFVAAVVMIMLAVSGALAVRANAVGPAAPGVPPEEAGQGRHGRMMAMMTDILELNASQQAQIEEIFKSNREAMRPYHEQVRSARNQIRDLVNAGSFDEAKVRELAQQASSARVEMIVAKARVHSQVLALLTPEQQKLAKKLAPLFEGRRGHHGPRGGKFCE